MNNKTITIGEVRLSYCNLFVPKPPFNNPAGEPKFSTTILVPKSNLQAKAAIDAAINAAIEEGVGKCWKGVRPPVPAICVHDGDGARPSDGSPFGEECKGCWVFTASCKSERAPFVVDGNVQTIIQQSEIYSGVYGNISVSFFAYENSGKKGIGCGLNGFQKTRDGEPLGSSISAAEAFSAVAPAAPAYPGYAPQTAPAAPAYPQQAASAYPGYPPQTAAPAYPAPQQYPVDPVTGQPMPTGMPVMGVLLDGGGHLAPSIKEDAMHHLSIDIETYSPEPIAKTGLYKYAQHPDFKILLFGYSLDGEPPIVIDMTQPGAALDYQVVQMLLDPDVQKHAYNAAFEWYCISRHFKVDDQWTASWLPQWRCTMLQGQYCGYPAGLDAVGKALGLPADKQKLATGKALIKYFCTPCRPTKANGGRTRNLPQHDPAKWEMFIDYNRQDVVTEMEVARRFASFPVPDAVQKQWELDQLINLRGVAVDLPLVDGALWCGQQARDEAIAEATQISGLDNPNSVAQLTEWLQRETGEELGDLRKDTVKDLLDRGVSSEAATRMLQIRQELGKTSTKKYDAIETCVCADGRVRGLLAFYGANRTGREAGRLVQVQNLPHDTVSPEGLARELVKAHQLDALRVVYGSVPVTLAALIRTSLVAGEGKVFIDADFSAIEARVIAWLAQESWVLDVFRTHGKIYEATASQMFGIPMDRIKKGNPEYAYRAKGKVATLALGYQGGPGALINMGALRSGLTEDELPDIVKRWRRANPAIVQFWYEIEQAAQAAVATGATTQVGPVTISRELDIINGLDFMTVLLPAGRKLYYAQPHIGSNRFGSESLCYHGMNQNTKKWATVETYGGKLVENITQAVARDCLFFAMENLEAAGYRIVFDVHDEVIIEAPDTGDHDGLLAGVVRIMSQPIPWAPGLPLNADGWVGGYYKKD